MTHAVLTINGTQRDLMIYRPSTAQSLPLLIFFDGTGSDFASVEANSGYFREFADSWNTIIAVPAQRVMSYGDWDNHSAGTPYFETAVGDSTSSAPSSNPDTNNDLLFTRAIIKEASVAYGADLTRVYVNGFSNGALFSYFAAATLNDKIAAFAESSGGLVLSNTTFGDPTPCAPTALPASTGAVRSCTGAGWSAGLCSTPGAMARPIAPSSVAKVPPGFMEANDNDTTVPWAHTCNLANALPASGDYQVRIVHSGLGHAMNDDYLNNSWNFMKNFHK
jgi:predicted esterase